MADQKIFENKVGWFSNSCANEVVAKWGEYGGAATTNADSALFLFSDDSNCSETRKLWESDPNVAIFKSSWIEDAIQSCATRVSTYGIEKYMLIPHEILDAEMEGYYTDGAKYKQYGENEKRDGEERWKAFEKKYQFNNSSKRTTRKSNAAVQSKTRSQNEEEDDDKEINTKYSRKKAEAANNDKNGDKVEKQQEQHLKSSSRKIESMSSVGGDSQSDSEYETGETSAQVKETRETRHSTRKNKEKENEQNDIGEISDKSQRKYSTRRSGKQSMNKNQINKENRKLQILISDIKKTNDVRSKESSQSEQEDKYKRRNVKLNATASKRSSVKKGKISGNTSQDDDMEVLSDKTKSVSDEEYQPESIIVSSEEDEESDSEISDIAPRQLRSRKQTVEENDQKNVRRSPRKKLKKENPRYEEISSEEESDDEEEVESKSEDEIMKEGIEHEEKNTTKREKTERASKPNTTVNKRRIQKPEGKIHDDAKKPFMKSAAEKGSCGKTSPKKNNSKDDKTSTETHTVQTSHSEQEVPSTSKMKKRFPKRTRTTPSKFSQSVRKTPRQIRQNRPNYKEYSSEEETEPEGEESEKQSQNKDVFANEENEDSDESVIVLNKQIGIRANPRKKDDLKQKKPKKMEEYKENEETDTQTSIEQMSHSDIEEESDVESIRTTSKRLIQNRKHKIDVISSSKVKRYPNRSLRAPKKDVIHGDSSEKTDESNKGKSKEKISDSENEAQIRESQKRKYALRSSEDEFSQNSQISPDEKRKSGTKSSKRSKSSDKRKESKKHVKQKRKSSEDFKDDSQETEEESLEDKENMLEPKGSEKQAELADEESQAPKAYPKRIRKKRENSDFVTDLDLTKYIQDAGGERVPLKLPSSSENKKRKLFRTSSGSMLPDVSNEQEISTPAGRRRSCNIGDQQLSPVEIHNMLNKSPSKKEVLLSGDMQSSVRKEQSVLNKDMSPQVLLERLSTDNNIGEITKAKSTMAHHLKTIKHKKIGEAKNVADFTLDSFTGFPHVDELDIPNASLQDFIVNKNGCRVKLVKLAI